MRIRERERFFFLSLLLSKIYENRTVGFRRSKRQSRSTYQELRVGTKILAFCQTPRGREFSYLCYFYPKGHLMACDLLRGRKFQSKIFGLSEGIFRNFSGLFSNSPGLIFGNIFGQSGLNFRDCFGIVRIGFSELFSGNPGLC